MWLAEKLFLWSAAVWTKLFLDSEGVDYNFELSGARGIITSPHYPRNYPLNTTCKWTITGAHQRRIRIHFTDFRLEKNKKCLYDYVQIRELKISSGQSIRKNSQKYCGYNVPEDYVSQGDHVEVRFVSDPMSEVERGFRIDWTTIYEVEVLTSVAVSISSSLPKDPPVPPSTICPTRTVIVLKATNCPFIDFNIINHNCKCNESKQNIIMKTILRHSHSVPGSLIHPTASTNIKLEASTVRPKKERQNTDNCTTIGLEEMQDSTDTEHTSLVVTFGTLFFITLLINFILLILFCRRKLRSDISSSKCTNWCAWFSMREKNRAKSPEIYFENITRPTLRMIDGKIVVLSREEDFPSNEKEGIEEQSSVQDEEENGYFPVEELPDLTHHITHREDRKLDSASDADDSQVVLGLADITTQMTDSSSEAGESEYYFGSI